MNEPDAGYIVAVTDTRVTDFVAISYVRDLDRSRAFYRALGFEESTTGSNGVSAWSALQQAAHRIVLATSRPPLDIPLLPLHFYFFVADLEAAMAAIRTTGATIEHVGYPPHALGGEAKTLDPDGNTILIGQPERSPSQTEVPVTDPADQFSLLRETAALAKQLREAAALAQHRAGADRACQVGETDGRACSRPAEIKLADAWGDTAWACIPHAEEALISAPGAFIANDDDQGLGPFLAQRRRP